MSTYKVTVSNNNIKVDAATTSHKTTVSKVDYGLSLSRVGGQGSKGDTISNIEFDSSNNFVVTVTGADGSVASTYNLGPLGNNTSLGNLADVNMTGVADDQVVQFDSSTSTFIPHTLTTTSLTDLDNAGKTDGAMLLYDGSSSKYKATTQLNNGNTFLIGGSY